MLTRPRRNARYSSRNVVAAVAIVLFAAGSIAKAANQTFLPAAGDYGTAANWSGSVIPGNGNNDEPQIGWNLSPRVATYSTATNYTTTDRIVVGLGSGNGTLIMNGAAGTLTFGGDTFGNANYIGVDGGAGLLDVQAGTFRATGGAYLRVGSNAAGANGTVLVSGSGVVDVNSLILVGNGNATNVGAIDVSGNGQLLMNRLDVVSNLNIGPGGTGSLTVSGNGLVATQGANPRIFIGSGVAGAGNATLSLADSGVINSGHDFIIGFTSGSTGSTQTGGTINIAAAGSYFVGAFANGDMTQTGGSVVINSASPNGLRLGHGGGAVNGVYNLNGGTLELATMSINSAGSAFNFGGGTLKANGALSTPINMTLTGVGGDAKVDSNGNNIALGGVLSGVGGLTKQGAGTLTLTGGNTYSGPTTVNAGTLAFAGGGTSNVASGITVQNGGVLRFDRNDTWGNHLTAATPVITVDAGGVVQSNDKFTALIGLVLNGGTLSANDGVNANFPTFGLKGTVTVNGTAGGSFISTTGVGNFNTVAIGNGSAGSFTTFDVADGAAASDLTVSAPLSNLAGVASGLIKTGAGTMTLTTNASSFSGNLVINSGTVIANGATLGLNPGATTLGAAGPGGNIIVNAGATLEFSQHDQLGNAGTTNQRLLTVSGGQVISNNSLNTLGNVALNGGTLTANGGPNFGGSNIGTFQLNGNVTVGGAAASLMNDTGAANSRYLLSNTASNGFTTSFNVADATGDASADLTVSTIIANGWGGTAASLTKTGVGTMLLSADNIYTGTTRVSGGNLDVAGSITGSAAAGSRFVVNGGTLTFNSAGASTFFSNGYANSSDVGENGATGVLNVQAGTVNVFTQAGAGSSYGSMRVGVNGAANGTVNVTGGTLNVDGRILMAANNGAAVGTLNISGGQVNLGNPGLYTTAGDPANGVLWFGVGTSTVNLDGGTLAMFGTRNSGPPATSVFNFNGGTLQAVGNNANWLDLGANMNAVVRAGGALIDTNGFSVGIAKPLIHDAGLGATPDGGLTKSGAGVLTLTSNASSFTGDVIVNSGTLIANGPTLLQDPANTTLGASGPSRNIFVNAGGTLEFSQSDQLGNANTTNQRRITVASGGQVVSNSVLTVLGNMTLNGGTVTANGGLNFGGSFVGAYQLNGDITVGGSAASLMNDTGAPFSRYLLSNTASNGFNTTFNVADVTGDANADLTISTIIANGWGGTAASLTKAGAGTMLLTNNGSLFTGDLVINDGAVIANGGLLGLNPGATTLGASGPGRNIFVNAGGTLEFSQHDQLGNADTTNQRLLTVSGSQVISNNSLTTLGNVALNGGTLTANGGPNFGGSNIGTFQLNGNVTVGGAAASLMNDTGAANSRYLLSNTAANGFTTTFNVADATGDASADLTVSTIIANGWAGNAGNLTKTGVGTMQLTAANIYTGRTTVAGGTLDLDGSIDNSGEVVVNHSGVSGGMTDGRLLIDSAGARTLGNAGTGSGDLIVGDNNFGYLQHGADPGPTAATSTVGHDLIVGRSAGGNGLVDVNDGTTLNVTNQLRIGNGAGTGVVNVKAGGTLNVLGNTTIIDSPVGPNFGILNIAGAFNENGDLVVGDNFTGVVNHTAGTASVNNDINATGNLIMGRTSATSAGTYNLTDGTLWLHGDGTAAGTTSGNSDIGAVGVGVVNQNGGTVLNDTHMTVGAAPGSQYNLAAGTLNFRDRVASTQAVATDNVASTLTVGGGGDFNFTGGTLMNVSTIDVTAAPAQSGAMYAGTFLQEGGDFVIGVDGGLDVNDANLTRALTQITGNFAQTGGSLSVDIFGDKVRGRSGEAGDDFFNLGDPLAYATDSDLLYVTGTAELDGSVDLTIADGVDLQPWGWYDVVYANGGITLGSGFAVNGGAGIYRILNTPNGQILQVAVPEPATLAVWTILAACLGLGFVVRRKR